VKITSPAKEKLISSVVSLLEIHKAEEISVEMVIKESGISNGSLYHHFKDLHDLIDYGLVARFSAYVDSSIEMLNQVSQTVQNKEQLIQALRQVTRVTQAREMLAVRATRIWTLGQTTIRPSFKELLGVEQERLTNGLVDLIKFAQEKGWYRSDLDPLVAAVFIQSYTIGKYVDDVTPQHMDDDKWNKLIDEVIENIFIINP